KSQLTSPVFTSVDSGEAVGVALQSRKVLANIIRSRNRPPSASDRWSVRRSSPAFFMRIVGCVEHLNLALSAVGNPPIYDKTIFPWTLLDRVRVADNPCPTPARALREKRKCPPSTSLPPTHRRSAMIASGRASYWPAMACAPITTSACVQKHGAS